MANDLEVTPTLGPAMTALNERQRKFVDLYMQFPTWKPEGLAKAAGYCPNAPANSEAWRITGGRLMSDPKILAAMDEETNKRMRFGGILGVANVVAIAMNPAHKDHLKASLALMNRTGRHEMTEQKLTIDDKRPETKAELVKAIKASLTEIGMSIDDAKEFIKKTTGEDVIDADFEVIRTPQIADNTDEEIAKQMEDL